MRTRFRVADVRSLPKKGITQVNLVELDGLSGALAGFIALPVTTLTEAQPFQVGKIFDVILTPAE